jgi:hypothetical protein
MSDKSWSAYVQVRELVRDPTMRVKDIAELTGYNKGHVSRLRKMLLIRDQIKAAEAKQWTGMSDGELERMWIEDTTSAEDCRSLYFFKKVSRAVELKLKERNA